jgi:hypothetical protein
MYLNGSLFAVNLLYLVQGIFTVIKKKRVEKLKNEKLENELKYKMKDHLKGILKP